MLAMYIGRSSTANDEHASIATNVHGTTNLPVYWIDDGLHLLPLPRNLKVRPSCVSLLYFVMHVTS